MVDTGVITTEQAYEMMGIDRAPRSNDDREKKPSQKDSKEGTEKISFCMSPSSLIADKLFQISLIFDGTKLQLLVNNEFCAEASAEGPPAEGPCNTSSNTLPASIISLGGMASSNPYLLASNQTKRELPYFMGILCEAALTIDAERKCYWPLTSMTLGVDLEKSGYHLSVWKKGFYDLRLLPTLNADNKKQFQRLEEKPASSDSFHCRLSNRCQLAGIAKTRGNKVVLGDGRNGRGALWFSERHEVTGGFDFTCISCPPAKYIR